MQNPFQPATTGLELANVFTTNLDAIVDMTIVTTVSAKLAGTTSTLQRTRCKNDFDLVKQKVQSRKMKFKVKSKLPPLRMEAHKCKIKNNCLHNCLLEQGSGTFGQNAHTLNKDQQCDGFRKSKSQLMPNYQFYCCLEKGGETLFWVLMKGMVLL